MLSSLGLMGVSDTFSKRNGWPNLIKVPKAPKQQFTDEELAILKTLSGKEKRKYLKELKDKH